MQAMYSTQLEVCRDNQVSQASEVAKEVVCKMCPQVFRKESDKKHY